MDTLQPAPPEAIKPRTFATINEALRAATVMPPEQIHPIRLADLEAQHTVKADTQINAMYQADYVGRASLGDNFGFGGGRRDQEPRKTMCDIYDHLSNVAISAVMHRLADTPSFAKLKAQFADKIPPDKLSTLVGNTIRKYFSYGGMNLESGIGDVFEGRGSWSPDASNSLVIRFASQLIPQDRADRSPPIEYYRALARSLLVEQLYGGVYDLTGSPPEQKQLAMQFLREGLAMSMKKAAEHFKHTMRQDGNRERIAESFGIAGSNNEMDTLLHDISEIAAQLVDTDPDLVTTTLIAQARKKLGVEKQARLVREIPADALKLRPTRWERAVTRLRAEIDKIIPPGVKQKYQHAKLWATDYLNTGQSEFRFPVKLPDGIASALRNVPEDERAALTARLINALGGPTTWQERTSTASPAFLRASVAASVGSTIATAFGSVAGFFIAGAGLEASTPSHIAIPRLMAGLLTPVIPASVVGGFDKEIGNVAANRAVVAKRAKDIEAFMKSEGIME